MPKDWKKRLTRGEDGIIYEKPGTKGTTNVRVMKAKPNSSNSGQQKDGKFLDVNGNILPRQSGESHIPMSNKIYIENIIDILKELSDKEYQTNVWLHMNNPNNWVGSFTEAVCGLFDDCAIDSLLKENEVIISKPITEILQSMADVIDNIDGHRPEEEIIDDPKMQIVRDKAARILALIEASDGSESTVQFVKAGTPDTPITIEEALKATA